MASQRSRNNSNNAPRHSGRMVSLLAIPRRRRIGWLLGLGLALTVTALGVWGYGAIRGDRVNADALWQQAQDDLRAGRIDRVEHAVARLRRLRRPTPLDHMLFAQLAIAHVQPDGAMAELAQVPDDHRMAAQARQLAGQIELRYYRLRTAERFLKEALRLDPGSIQVHRELICIYGLQLRRVEVGREFLILSSMTDLTFSELFHWAFLRGECWEPATQAGMLIACVEADPGDRDSRLTLSENYRLMGMLAKAESVLAGVPLDDPRAIAAHARIALDRNDEERAERLLESGPPDAPALAALRGRLALSRRDPATARRYFQVAYDADEDHREALSGLIASLVALGDSKAAAPLRAVAADRERLNALIHRAGAMVARDASNATPEDPDLPLLLGDACAAVHHDAEARGWYKIAIARDPLDSRAQQALYRLNAAPRNVPPSTRPGT